MALLFPSLYLYQWLYMYIDTFNIFNFHIIFLSGNVMFGHQCVYGMQCTGTEFASLCQYGQCKCQSGYTSIGYNCYPGRNALIWLLYLYN